MIESCKFSVQHHTRFAFDCIEELRRQNQLCDISLRVGGRDFLAHKIVLAGCSPYLRAMFTNGMLETEKNCVDIYDIDSLTMELLLDFMYTSTIEISVKNVQNILQGASLLGIRSLRNLCSQFLQSQLAASNCLGIQYFADRYTCEELEASAKLFIYQNFVEVMQTEEFYQLPENRLLDLLKSDKLHVMNERQVFEASCAWIQADPNARTDNSCRILQNIKLALLDVHYLESVVLKYEFFRGCQKCQSLIRQAVLMQEDILALRLITPRAQPPSIYVLGGRNSTDCQLKSMERYDFFLDRWMAMPSCSMNIARTAVSACALDGQLYSVGGECALIDTQEDTLYLRCVECFDPIQKTWTPKAELKIARSFIALAAVGGFLYAIGGEDRTCSYCIVEKYSPLTENWVLGTSMKRKRSGSGVTVCDGKIYVAGGYDKTLHLDRASMECYDPDTQEWAFMAEMEKARSGLLLTALDHNIYSFGGRFRHTDQYFDLVERFNTLSRQWTTIAPMCTPRAWPGMALFDGRIYVVGGFDGTSRLRSAEVYDPETNRWTFINNMLVGRAGCGAAMV